MVQVLDEVPSFGTQLARSLGQGAAQGLGQATNFAQQLMFAKEMEKLKRGTLIDQGKASVPQELQGNDSAASNVVDLIAPISQSQSQKRSSPVLNPEQLKQQAAIRVNQKAERGLPSSYEDELRTLTNENAMALQQRDIQNRYGSLAEEALQKIMPGASDETKSIISSKIQNLSNEGYDEAHIKKQAAREAQKIANQHSAIVKSLPPPDRFFTKVGNLITGKGRNSEAVRNSVKLKIKPLLDEGQFDTARRLMQKAGYAPEERETIISDLSEPSQKVISQFEPVKRSAYNKLKNRAMDEGPARLDEQDLFRFRDSLKDLFTKDPSTNIILARKEYEDKGVNWKDFADILQDLEINNEIQLNDDQQNYRNVIDEPPLGRLQRALHAFGLAGR